MNDEGKNTETPPQLFTESDVHTVLLAEYVRWFSGKYNLIQLPPLQRDAVWKVAQIERLWDSLLRGFPIGSFVLAPFKKGDPAHSIESREQKPADRDGWFLLDGQQRTRALALGFSTSSASTARLWIDMAPQASSTPDRAFLFRLCTERHPWGMQRSDPDRKVEDDVLREAREQLRKVCPEKAEEVKLHNDYGLPLDDTWPVQAMLPAPFAKLIQRVSESRNIDAIIEWTDLLPKTKCEDFGKERKRDCEQRILKAIQQLLLNTQVVLLKLDPGADPMLDIQENEGIGVQEHGDAPDAMETLFERVNSGGTRLEGEEMMFSLLKGKWPEAYTLVQNIVDHAKAGFLLPPTAIVLSAARLALACNKGKDSEVVRPKVRQFRRWIAEKTADGKSDGPFLEKMKRFIKPGESSESSEPRFVHVVRAFLKATEYHYRDHVIGLPRPLLLVLNRYAIEVVLHWIDRVFDAPDFQASLADSRLPILRFLIHSLLAWTDAENASRRAFKVLSSETGDQFPDAEIYKRLVNDEEGAPVALKMPPPDDMENRVKSDHGHLRSYEELFSSQARPHGDFVKRFWHEKAMLLWFQRADLSQLFRGYDPLKPESAATPFDYDHILPYSHLTKQNRHSEFEADIDLAEKKAFENQRWIYRDSIGNFRIWPAWANRKDKASLLT